MGTGKELSLILKSSTATEEVNAKCGGISQRKKMYHRILFNKYRRYYNLFS